MVVSIANIMSSTVLLKMSEYVDDKYIYWGTSGLTLIVALLISFFMSDVVKKDTSSSEVAKISVQ